MKIDGGQDMKKSVIFLFPAILSVLATGCGELEPEIPMLPAEEPEVLVHKSFLAETAETRTTLDGVDVLFAEGESISIYDGTANREFKADEAGRSVSFSGEVSSTATEFYALSPYSASAGFLRDGESMTVSTVLASEQAAVPGTFAASANISAAKSTSEDVFSLQNVLSVAKFTLASANLGGHEIVSVELTSDHPLAGDVVVTYGDAVTAAAGVQAVNTVKLAKGDGSALSDGVYYMTLLPNEGGRITLTFTASDGFTATRTATLKSAFEAGTIKNLGTVKGLDWEAPKYYFVPVSTVTEGTYMIVSDNNGALLAAKPVVPASGNTYGYPQALNVTDKLDNNGFLVVDDLDAAFEFTATGSGYTIRQSDGKYWYQSGNYTSISIDDAVSGNSYYDIIPQADGTFKILSKTVNRYLQYSTSYKTFGSYNTVSGIAPALYRLVNPDEVEASVMLTTLDATGVTGTSAVLNAVYTGLFPLNAVEVGFQYGTSATALDLTVYDGSTFTTSSGSITAEVSSLSEHTTYYYRVTMQVYDPASGTYKEFIGETLSFTTGGNEPVSDWKGWLELPANTLVADNYLYDEQWVGDARNYTISYDKSMFTSMWVAYPLYSATMGSSPRPTNWSYNGHIPEEYQINILKKSYGISWTASYGNELYARGHQIPNADRNVDSDWQDQTFLATNCTPQIQNRFNGSIWGSLEDAVRTAANGTDTVYVVTGPVFRKVGGSEEIEWIQPQNDTKECPVPNYYWKALLKVKRSGRTVTSASAIGFWFEHRAYEPKDSYANYIVSIDQIEAWTGLDLFTNLPGDDTSGLEKDVESVAGLTWNAFLQF